MPVWLLNLLNNLSHIISLTTFSFKRKFYFKVIKIKTMLFVAKTYILYILFDDLIFFLISQDLWKSKLFQFWFFHIQFGNNFLLLEEFILNFHIMPSFKLKFILIISQIYKKLLNFIIKSRLFHTISYNFIIG